METGDMSHVAKIGDPKYSSTVIKNAMIHAKSPVGRISSGRQMLTGDPYNVNVTLDPEAKNRDVEIFMTYLKTMGLKMEFDKVDIEPKHALGTAPITYMYYGMDPQSRNPLIFMDRNEKYDPEYLLDTTEYSVGRRGIDYIYTDLDPNQKKREKEDPLERIYEAEDYFNNLRLQEEEKGV
jgi:hypothetical protein